jgi:hypothetical protein
MSVALALYKGKGNWVNSIIRWRSQSIYSHCELIVDGWMYSSTVRDGGVRCKIGYLPEEEWDIIPIHFNNGESILSHYSETKNNPYGWRDLAQSQIFGRSTADDKGDFCSEWCAAAIGLPNAATYTPERLGEVVRWANSLVTK